MSNLREMSRADIEALFDIVHDDYKTVCQQNAALKKKLAKAVAALRQIDTETFTDAPVASLHEIRRLVHAVLKELEK